MTGVPFYFDVRQTSVGWAMSQLSRAAEVVWLLELTATIRPNSAVMSVAEEAGITRFKALLQKKKKKKKDELISLCTVRGRTWSLQPRAKSTPSHCSIPESLCCCQNMVTHESGSTHPRHVGSTSGKKKADGGSLCSCVWSRMLPCMHGHTRVRPFFFFFFFHDAISGLIH